ncbi:phage tail protein I [Chromohalobacter sp.]|uniref:phage tail protein I n=1 Tax=Chromohalobacter sp. TaxID=50740 RepID=UPI003242F64E
MNDRFSLLPPNASALERAAAEALAEIERVGIPIRDLHDPWRCPARLLPYLAWSRSVDRWDASWPEATQRKVIADSFYVHRLKGTPAALRRIVEPLGYVIEFVPWHEMDPPGPRGTFALRIGVEDRGIDEQTYFEMTRLIDAARAEGRHITGLSIEVSTDLALYAGAMSTDGDILDVYPWETHDIDVAVLSHQATAIVGGTDTLEVSING